MPLAAIGTVGTIVQTLLAIRSEFRQARQEREHQQLERLIQKLDVLRRENVLTKQEVLELFRMQSGTPSRVIVQKVFGDQRTLEEANAFLRQQSEGIGRGNAIPASAIRFTPSDLCFSSFGTPGYISYLPDGKSVVVYHCTGDDSGRVFAAQWGIGYYYRTYLRPNSFLGFPTSNEYSTLQSGRNGARNDFEGGYIEYIAEYNCLQIYRTAMKGKILVGVHRL